MADENKPAENEAPDTQAQDTQNANEVANGPAEPIVSETELPMNEVREETPAAEPEEAIQPEGTEGEPAEEQKAETPTNNPTEQPTAESPADGPTETPCVPPAQAPYDTTAQPFDAPKQAPCTNPVQQPYGTAPQQPFVAASEPKKNSNTGCFIALGIVALLSFVAGLLVFMAIFNVVDQIGTSVKEAVEEVIDPDGTSSSSSDTSSESKKASNNASLRIALGETASTDAFTKKELEGFQKEYFADSKATGKNKPQGIYFVGSDIKAGDYWMGGSDSESSYFYVLEKDGKGYSCRIANNYYGHNLISVSKGEVLVVINGSEGFCKLSDMNETFSDPYTNGVFRVGTDIPAGTYTLKAGKDSDSYCAYYIMSNLSYEGDYITEQKHESDQSKMSTYTITVEEGQYLELYNCSATQGSKA